METGTTEASHAGGDAANVESGSGVTVDREGTLRLSRASAAFLRVLALASAVAGAWLIDGASRAGLSLGILLLVLSLGSAAIVLGGETFGPDAEGPLDLSARLALGLLGGLLAGLTQAALTRIGGATGLFGLLGVGIDSRLAASEWALRCAWGSGLGLAFGVLFRRLPGTSSVRRGAWFSLLPTAYLLLYYYPITLGVGLLGMRLGFLTPFVVAFVNLVPGAVAGAVMGWGERTDLAPISRPLVG
ncbi:MAG: hypothetical protein ACE5JR_11155 [Gemmatimonadota bacterium]